MNPFGTAPPLRLATWEKDGMSPTETVEKIVALAAYMDVRLHRNDVDRGRAQDRG